METKIMERIDQNERHMMERLERHDWHLRVLQDHFCIRHSPAPSPTPIPGEGQAISIPEPISEDELRDPKEVSVERGHEEISGFGGPTT